MPLHLATPDGARRIAAGHTRAPDAALAARHLLGRLGQPGEVPPLVCVLLSGEASLMTGGSHLIDGGDTAV